MKNYTEKEVIELLRQQRVTCAQVARIVSHTYVNPYSDSDGQVDRVINKDQIINAESPLKS